MQTYIAQLKKWFTEHKKSLACILFVAIIIFAVVGPVPFGAKTARAADWLDIFSLHKMAANLGWLIMKVVSWALGLAGMFFDVAINYSINMDQSILKVVESGWAVGRDVANMFFIFLTLYIGIATILQLSTYNLKSLLVTVIIIALLVNFSLVFTKVIIDASNMLALEFYNKLNTITDTAGKPVGLSAAIVSGMNPQKLFNMDLGVEGEINSGGVEPTLFQIFIITIMGSFLIASAAFVLFAAGVLFIARTASLWIIMMLSSLAFVAMAVPKLKGYADNWWKQLFNQSFFAPAFLFLYYLVIKIVVEGNILAGLTATNAATMADTSILSKSTVMLVINFVILIFLMFACLKIAKDMGATGADAMQKWGGAMQDWGIGKVKLLYKAPIYGAGRGAGWAAQKALKSAEDNPEGFWGKTIRNVPLVGRTLSKVSSVREKQMKKATGDYEKEYKSYSPEALKAMSHQILTPTKQAAISKLLKEYSAKEAKKKAVKDEPEELKRINAELASLQASSDADDIEIAEIEASFKELEKNSDKITADVARNTRAELVVKRKRINERKQRISELKQDKNKIEERQERRKEMEGIEERFGKLESASSAKPESKPAGGGESKKS